MTSNPDRDEVERQVASAYGLLDEIEARGNADDPALLALRDIIAMLNDRHGKAQDDKLKLAQQFDKYHPDPALMSRIILKGQEHEHRAELAEAALRDAQAQLATAHGVENLADGGAGGQGGDAAAPDDFARLFRVPGVGQVLAYLDDNDEDMPAVFLRIPDAGSARLELALSMNGPDYDKSAAFARQVLEGMRPDSLVEAVRPLTEMKARFVPEQESEGTCGPQS